jgi:hypothetical protein
VSKIAVPFYNTKVIINLFIDMGCVLTPENGVVECPDGDDFTVRELKSPETGGFTAIIDLDDNEFIPATEVDVWERRLGVVIPRPPR